MKKLLCILVVALIMPVMALAQDKYLGNFPTGDNIENVYLDSDVINLVMSQLESDPEIALYKAIFKDLTGMEVYTCANVGKIKEVNTMLAQLVEAKKASALVDSVEGDSRSVVYTVSNSADGKDDAMIICSLAPAEAFIMVLYGDIDLARLAAFGM